MYGIFEDIYIEGDRRIESTDNKNIVKVYYTLSSEPPQRWVKSLEGWITPKESAHTSQPTDCLFNKIKDEQIVYRCPQNFDLKKRDILLKIASKENMIYVVTISKN